jgi:hypothetical protein
MAGEKIAQKRVQAYVGMNVKTIQQHGSTGQKMMVSLFDTDKDGVFCEYEAIEFNRYSFTTEKGKITMREQYEGKVHTTELIYDDFEKDVLHKHNGMTLNTYRSFNFEKKDGDRAVFDARYPVGGKTTIDMVNGKVTVQGVEASRLFCTNAELTVKDSTIQDIDLRKAKLNLENTSAYAPIGSGSTDIVADGDSVINADGDSDYDVEIRKEK